MDNRYILSNPLLISDQYLISICLKETIEIYNLIDQCWAYCYFDLINVFCAVVVVKWREKFEKLISTRQIYYSNS